MQPEFKPGLWGSGAHAVYHGPAASWGLSCLGHDQDLAGTRGAWGFKGASCFSLDTAAAGRGLMPSSPDSNEELCVAQGLAHRGQ